jgi:signal transduction histidine kinase
MRLSKHVPWFILFLLWAGGAGLWLLFVAEQQGRLTVGLRNQLERTAEELLRGRLEGRLGPGSLPQGIRAFAVYGPDGVEAESWGTDAPERLTQLPEADLRRGRTMRLVPGGWVDFVKVLVPLRPRMNFWGDEGPQPPPPENDPRFGDGPGGPEPGDQRRFERQGYLFLRVSDAPLQGRLWAWTLGGVLGSAGWAAFLAFGGLLWFRTRRYQAAMAEHRDLLQFAEASRTLSHELQNPLAAILLQTALLKRAAGGEPSAEVSIIEEEARRMSGLVARVRDFLKDPRGQAERVDLAELAATLRERFAVVVELAVEGSTPYTVVFDPHRLRSVVENLLKNAAESGPDPRPAMRLSRPRSGWVRLEVLDSGSGFTPESLKSARDPFYTTKTSGTGIGLSIASSFVRAAGGKLKLENRPEGGAKVSLDLPEAPEEDAR